MGFKVLREAMGDISRWRKKKRDPGMSSGQKTTTSMQSTISD
jgi:hypothetical protein